MGPLAPELRTALKEQIRKIKPELLMTRIQDLSKKSWDVRKPKVRQRMGAGSTSGRGTSYFHLFFNTIPCWADSQPAELLWMLSKRRAGNLLVPKRTINGTWHDWLIGLYGGSKALGVGNIAPEHQCTETYAPITSKETSGWIRTACTHLDEHVKGSLRFKASDTCSLDDLAMGIEIDPADPVGNIVSPWATGDLVELLGCLEVRGEHHIEQQDTGADSDGDEGQQVDKLSAVHMLSCACVVDAVGLRASLDRGFVAW